MDEVFDDLIVILNGRGDNKFVLIIDSEDGVDFIWIEMIMVKVFWDGWGVGIKIIKVIFQILVGLLSVVLQILVVFFVILLIKQDFVIYYYG